MQPRFLLVSRHGASPIKVKQSSNLAKIQRQDFEDFSSYEYWTHTTCLEDFLLNIFIDMGF
jgi:hypothetical protein